MILDNFLPYILPEVPGCPDPTLRLNLATTAQDFCKETHSWTEIKTAVPLVDGTQDYVIAAPTDALVRDVRDVWVGNRRLSPATMDEIGRALPSWQSGAGNEPIYYNQVAGRGTLRFYPMPANTNGITFVVRAVYVPTIGAASLPDYLFNEHLDAIASGAKARLMRMVGVPWSNPELGMYYQSLYETGVTKCRNEEQHERVQGSIRVAPRSFGF